MTNVFETIDKYFATDPPGWTTPIIAKTFAACVIALRPSLVIEIGVFGGRATIPIAIALREVGTGMINAIDPWDFSASIEGQGAENAAWWKNANMHEDVRQRFLKDVRDIGIQNCINVIRSRSDDASPHKCQMLLIDGNHGPQAIKDVERFAPHVDVGGLVYMDDLNWEFGNVQKAVNLLITKGFSKLYGIGTGAMFQRIRA